MTQSNDNCPTCIELLVNGAKLAKKLESTQVENARLREFIEGIYMNTSTSMPAEWNDEASWYASQLRHVIGRAARFTKELREVINADK